MVHLTSRTRSEGQSIRYLKGLASKGVCYVSSMCDDLDMRVSLSKPAPERAKAFKFLWNAGTMHKVLQVQDRIEYTYLRSKIYLDFRERFNTEHERFNTVNNTSLWNRDSASVQHQHPFVILRAFAVRASRSIAAPWSIEYTTYRPSTFMSASGDVVFREPRMPLWFRIQTKLEPPETKPAAVISVCGVPRSRRTSNILLRCIGFPQYQAELPPGLAPGDTCSLRIEALVPRSPFPASTLCGADSDPARVSHPPNEAKPLRGSPRIPQQGARRGTWSFESNRRRGLVRSGSSSGDAKSPVRARKTRSAPTRPAEYGEISEEDGGASG
ncbi:hypothetical protein C8R43DRAFT_1245316 [Mycena crocata]|nr:hypothetical protein C8R43DRAFT_1245316 [Mycena crocata]